VQEEVKVAASKSKRKPKNPKSVAEVIEETPAGEEDPDVLAILKKAGL